MCKYRRDEGGGTIKQFRVRENNHIHCLHDDAQNQKRVEKNNNKKLHRLLLSACSGEHDELCSLLSPFSPVRRRRQLAASDIRTFRFCSYDLALPSRQHHHHLTKNSSRRTIYQFHDIINKSACKLILAT